MHLSRMTEEDQLYAGWNRSPIPFLSPRHTPPTFMWVHDHCKSRSSETSGGSGRRLWDEWNPERVQQFGKTPSQITIILKNLSKKPNCLVQEVKVLLWNFLPRVTESTNYFFLQYEIRHFHAITWQEEAELYPNQQIFKAWLHCWVE